MMKNTQGFTLMEVLLALAILAIALTALFKITAQNVAQTQRLKEKSISHWVAMQGVNAVQLGLIPVQLNQEVTQVTMFLGQRWYWRAKVTSSPIPSVEKITIKISSKQAGPFQDALTAFRYTYE